MTEFMAHAVVPNHHLESWPHSRTSDRRLPLPSNSYDPFPVVKQELLSQGPPTPPAQTMNGYSKYQQQQQQATSYPVRTQLPALKALPVPSRETSQSSGTYIKSSPPTLSTLMQAEPSGRQSPSNSAQVQPAFKLPVTIKAPQANLPQLAAEAACLFWFESAATIRQVDNWTPGTPVPPNAISLNAIPSLGFQQWVTTLLATTQVSPNVILLALLFIYKLKGFNQHIKGGPNSEYKLMTVALMLGNKFLDDNTYTNKTWAEVSGMPVRDVHVMEVEFLSNMRYSLFTAKAQWDGWHKKLGKIGTYLDLASKAREAAARPVLITPTTLHFPTALPSPPHKLPQLSPTFPGTYSPSHLAQSLTPILLPQPSNNAISPMGPLPELDPRFSRKRSYDESMYEPPAKRRVPMNFHEQQQNLPVTTLSQPHTQPQALHPPVSMPSLPMPIPYGLPTPMSTQMPAAGSRAMSMVYPTSGNHYQAPITQAAVIPPLQTTGLPAPILHPDLRQLSPFPNGSATSSPINAGYTPGSQMQSRLSPSYFLAHRNSPYRPVRQVQTLVAPPSSTPLYNAPRLISQEQMQYHPLGRPMTERRVGQLPYLNHEAWPQHHQFNQWSEVIPPPAPNFHP